MLSTWIIAMIAVSIVGILGYYLACKEKEKRESK
jgi:hypothetical protein